MKQPTPAPTRKVKYGILGGALVTAIVAGLDVYDHTLAVVYGPVIFAIAGALGAVIPAYAARDRIPPDNTPKQE